MVKAIQSLYPSIEAVRFTNSGLEATLLAIRLGMAYTGRPSIAKFAGHYHGGHEQVLVSTHAVTDDATHLKKTAESMGLPDYFLQHTEILPFNNIEISQQILREHHRQIGVVMLEPLQAGYIPARQEFIRRLRDLTMELGMVLVFDEVKTGFRICLGGAQEFYGVRPDLTALGKVLGGGFPIGAVGGRHDILDLTSPRRSQGGQDVVFHSGTFNGNPMSLLAGLRTLEFLQQSGNYTRLLNTAENLRRRLQAISEAQGLPVKTVGAGSIFNLVFPAAPDGSDEEPLDPVVAENSPRHRNLRGKLDFLLMQHGVFSKPYNRFSVSLAHDATAINHTLEAFEQCMASTKTTNHSSSKSL